MAKTSREGTRRFLQLTFRNYYRNQSELVDVPDRIHTREFGLQTWHYNWICRQRHVDDGEGGVKLIGCGKSGRSYGRPTVCPICGTEGLTTNNWTRHVAFRSGRDLVDNLVKKSPHSVYHSAAFYKVPTARMGEKEWMGAELVFDIDADHLDAPCVRDHDSWMCTNPECGKKGKGAAPDTCPACGGTSLISRKWICDRCLEEAKKNTIKVHDEFLVDDFDIDPADIQLNYSGHRGYHIRVKDPKVFPLDSSARIEIVHYITGFGFQGKRVVTSGGQVERVTGRQVPGWGGKIVDAMVEFIRNIDEFEGKKRWITPLKKYKKEALEGLLLDVPILSSRVKGVGLKSWQEIADLAAEEYGGEIDVPVTHDIHRVIRLVGSLNGKTGFAVRELTRDGIDTFDPFADAVTIEGDKLQVKVIGGGLGVPSFRIRDEEYGPLEDGVLSLPAAASVFLMCKGVAVIE
ncbi:hypothetical protein EU545_01150 [Candidatus Thorarchaeota archaeon]|nr:MAG: hypothetical protein EU545_01150 [Candidatus Thorarchaeota archaeon]